MSLEPLSVMHVNVNCSNLERSLTFYRDHLGLVPQSHTNPMPQDGAGFGLVGRIIWDAYLLHDDRGFTSAAVDLLEWKRPLPIGGPIGPPHDDANQRTGKAPSASRDAGSITNGVRAANALGFGRLCLSHSDLDALHQQLDRAGVVCISEPISVPVLPEHSVRFFCCRDPDGQLVEFVERPGPARMSHLNINCSNLDVASDWYQNVLGVRPIADRAEPPLASGAGFGFSEDCAYRADFLAVDADPESLILDLLEWKTPHPTGQALREANQLGLFRMAFMVRDAAESCRELDGLNVEHSGVHWLEMGLEIPIDGLNAVFFRDPDGACLELIETPRLREQSSLAGSDPTHSSVQTERRGSS